MKPIKTKKPALTRSQRLTGYHACPCRDCFETAIGERAPGLPAMCWECQAARCSHDGDSECSVAPVAAACRWGCAEFTAVDDLCADCALARRPAPATPAYDPHATVGVFAAELVVARRALRALVLNPATRAWLAANDPKALAQAEDALPMSAD